MGWDRIEPSLGDQTLYTHMCLSEPHLCHRLPCGWNRQLSTRYFTAADFVQSWHACDARCRLIHFNQPLLERMVPVLQQPGRPPSCAECRAALGDLENAARTSKSKNQSSRGVRASSTWRGWSTGAAAPPEAMVDDERAERNGKVRAYLLSAYLVWLWAPGPAGHFFILFCHGY